MAIADTRDATMWADQAADTVESPIGCLTTVPRRCSHHVSTDGDRRGAVTWASFTTPSEEEADELERRGHHDAAPPPPISIDTLCQSLSALQAPAPPLPDFGLPPLSTSRRPSAAVPGAPVSSAIDDDFRFHVTASSPYTKDASDALLLRAEGSAVMDEADIGTPFSPTVGTPRMPAATRFSRTFDATDAVRLKSLPRDRLRSIMRQRRLLREEQSCLLRELSGQSIASPIAGSGGTSSGTTVVDGSSIFSVGPDDGDGDGDIDDRDLDALTDSLLADAVVGEAVAKREGSSPRHAAAGAAASTDATSSSSGGSSGLSIADVSLALSQQATTTSAALSPRVRPPESGSNVN